MDNAAGDMMHITIQVIQPLLQISPLPPPVLHIRGWLNLIVCRPLDILHILLVRPFHSCMLLGYRNGQDD